jgi:hypothetical protein
MCSKSAIGQAEFGEYFFMGDRLIIAAPLTGFGHRPFFVLTDLFVFNWSNGQFPRNRIEHDFHQTDKRGNLVGRQVIEKLQGVLFLIVHTGPRCARATSSYRR